MGHQRHPRFIRNQPIDTRGILRFKNTHASLGFSHPVVVDEIPGITIDVPAANKVVIRGIDKQVVGQFAAEVRGKRPPEPYKGKGVRYSTEVIHLKAGKTGGKK